MPAPKILISAGEASGDFYATHLVEALGRRFPDAALFGCAGPRMRRAGVRPVVDASSLSVVGLVEVLTHIPKIYTEFRKLVRAAEQERPQLAILTDSPDFHLRLAKRLRRLRIPVVYLVAPQVWAWRRGRVRTLRGNVARLLCIFPFEEEFFLRHAVHAVYIGHPLSRLVRASMSREEFFRKHCLPRDRPLVVLLPGSRLGEAARHLPALIDAADRIRRHQPAAFILAVSAGTASPAARLILTEPIGRSSIQLIEGETWDAIAHADLALAASGTVTVEAAILGTPMVTFYKVSALSWWMGRFLVNVPFYSMVNLVAGRRIVPELMQNEMTGERLALEAQRLLGDVEAQARMKRDLADVATRLSGDVEPMEKAATVVEELLIEGMTDAS